MRRDINYFFGIGNLVRDPDLRFTPQGTPVCRFSIAMNRRYRDKSGNFVDDTTFVTVAAWSKLGELCARYLSKGSRVAVVGELRSSSWEDRNGGKRVSYEVRAENIQFLTPARPVVQEEVKEFPDMEGDFETPEPFTFDATDTEKEILGDLEDIPVDDQEEGMAPF